MSARNITKYLVMILESFVLFYLNGTIKRMIYFQAVFKGGGGDRLLMSARNIIKYSVMIFFIKIICFIVLCKWYSYLKNYDVV